MRIASQKYDRGGSKCLNKTDHRPWSLPTGPWIDSILGKLLFAHWPIEPNISQSRIPAPLDLN
jgi:uncharacterized protein YqjF (DUF2071 family)